MKKVKRLFSFVKVFKWLLLVIIVLSIFNRFTYSYVPLFSQYLFAFLRDPLRETIYQVNFPRFVSEFLWPNEGITTVIKIVMMLAGFQTVRFTISFFETFLVGKLSEEIQFNLRNQLFNHLQSLEYSYHKKADIGDLIQRVTTDIETIGFFLSERIGEFFTLLATIIFGSLQLYFISPIMLLIILVFLPISAGASIVYFIYVNKSFKIIEENEAKMITVIQENLEAVKVVKAFANEKYEEEKLEKANLEYVSSQKKYNKKRALYWGSSDIFSMLQYSTIIIVAIFFVRNERMSADGLVATLLLIGMIVWPIRGLGWMIGDFAKALVSSDRIYEILEQESEFLENGDLKPPLNQGFTFKNVSFQFKDSNNELLKNVNFEINEGETVAIIGKTGSGKSTLVYLLLRMLEVSSGEILFGEVPIKEIEKHYLRKNIGLVMQEPFLYGKSIYDNIAITNHKITEEKVYQAANVANLSDEIASFKAGYQTMVGERGVMLSGGQKQRIGIARVLIEEKPILIFDDSLSAVDVKTDVEIRKTLKKDHRQTIIIITHRITTAKEADKIIVLENGQVSAIGNHQSLKNQKGLYQDLWEIQGSLEKEFLNLIEGYQDEL
ncbi:MAG: ABC transporter ATP-binding protein [Acholeplasmataceae bacterium]|jgi:ATP-binding cassette subfamily B protein|nr:ABC transporter ATP-binding protein/permease [Acholeplasmataceae bacterium]MCK9288772.1 ABC transporter ATP-binding protein/permease [Acholeplasmataceae bacterium]MCK9427322.1 ABC transporter ATP-binding protein/permease [Acholeplasmataceae bacterium]HHT39107.1 ABC transporter ATP-binding protein [Acholeplasmataceae bacterium]